MIQRLVACKNNMLSAGPQEGLFEESVLLYPESSFSMEPTYIRLRTNEAQLQAQKWLINSHL